MIACRLSPRWRKLRADLIAEKERFLLMLVAICVSLIAVGSVLGGYAVLNREMAANYLGTRPADASLELPGGVDSVVLGLARQTPAIKSAEAREVLLARVRVGDDWRPLLLFVIDDFADMRLNTFTLLAGATPPSVGNMLIERSASDLLLAKTGSEVLIKTAHGQAHALTVSGLVHDPGLAPAWQERMGYGYISRATLVTLGETPQLHELRIGLNNPAANAETIEQVAAALSRQLAENGRSVHAIHIPPPRQHPHQRQMRTILFLMLTFSFMALVLSGILTASSLTALLARQMREIGVMKTLGARAGQVAWLYGALVSGLGLASLLLAAPLGWLGAQILSNAVANLLNLHLDDSSVPAWVFAVQALAGMLVPLLLAAWPIRRAARLNVREALQQYDVGKIHTQSWAARCPQALRNALRRPLRLALTVALMAAGGAMFMTALNIEASWQSTIAKVYATRHYDVEVRFHQAQPASVARQLKHVAGVIKAEAWGYSPAAFARPGQIDVAHTYPDRSHASFAVMAPPATTRLIDFPVLAGRWLVAQDRDGVVLNHAAAAQIPNVRVGDRIRLSLDADTTHPATTWQVLGIVEEIGAAGVAYVTDQAFSAVAGTGDRSRLLRVVTHADSPEARLTAQRAIEQHLADTGVSVELAVPLAELRTAMADHITILIRSLIAMAAIMALVGCLGLTSNMGVSVLERTREFGVMKTLGATPQRISRLLVAEGLWIGALSWIGALLLSLPLTAGLDILIGRLGFVAPLPFIVAGQASLLWLVLIALSAFLATSLPARQAGRLSIVRALQHV